jgi:arabinofuranan 3-O-arabinosyltransferase
MSLRTSSTESEEPSLDAMGPVGDEGDEAIVPAEPPSHDRSGRGVLLAAAVGALLLAFIQAPGKIIDDTKLPLIMRPLAYMANSLHLWNPLQSSGSVQAGNFGYLFPMGPFFAIGQVLHVPVWITERVWLALLLTISFWGMVRLAEALGIGSPGARILGGIAYTVAPIVVTYADSSVAMLGTVFLPWVLVPLVRGSTRGSPRRAAAASGIAVALMSGVNATVVFAVLIPPVIWLVTRQPGPRRRALMSWWVVAVVLACFWWVAATYIEGHFGYNYLPYTETAVTTTATTSLFESVRGASFWTGYLTLGGPLIPGTWALISGVVPSLGTSVVAALGLVGLSRRGLAERLFLVGSLFAGIVVIAVGYDGSLGGPVAHSAQSILDGPLAALRNVSKFSPDVALPLALGLASFVSAVNWRHLFSRVQRGTPRATTTFRWLLGVVTVGALVAASAPFWQAKLYPSGGFSAIPSYWSAAANWLDHHQEHGTALLVPGASFAKYTWGRPLDEPLSLLLSSQWSVRSIVPLGSNGNDGVLDTVSDSLDSGVAEPGMGKYLARAGFDYVVVRNDLNLQATGAPPPAQVQQVLSETTGLRKVAAFGPVISSSQAAPGKLAVYDSATADQHLRSVEIYRVLPASPAVRTYPTRNPVVVSGSTGSLLPLVAAGVLKNRAAILAGDPHGGGAAAKASSATWADTDGNQRRDQSFGLLRNNLSYVLGPGQRTAAAIPSIPENLAVVTGEVHQTVADPLGAASVSASSYGSTDLALDPSEGPAGPFDQDKAQSWVANDVDDSVGQWIQINFKKELDLSKITVRPLADSLARPTVTEVAISTARGTVDRRLKKGTNTVTVPKGKSPWLRITLTHVRKARLTLVGTIALGAGISSVRIPGVDFFRALRLPSDEASSFAGRGGSDLLYSFSAPLSDANLFLGAGPDDDPQMIRRFTVPSATKLSLTGTATPTPSVALAAYLPAPASHLTVTATSTLGDLPRFSADNLITDSGRPWIAGFGDVAPALTLSWKGSRPVDSLVLDLSSETARPRKIVISSPTAQATVDVPPNGTTITFPTMVTDTLTIRFESLTPQKGVVPGYGTTFNVPVGLDHVSVPALGTTSTSADSSAPYVVPCGFGPTIKVDGKVLATSLSGTIGDLEALHPLALTVCGGAVTLDAGSHVLEAETASPFKVTSILARPSAPSVAPTRPARIVGSWSAQHRTVKVGRGAQSYLVVAENYNAGWHATLDGHVLVPARVDGWQQAWIVPAGSGGTVTMSYGPDSDYHLVLILGALFFCVLALLALARSRRKEHTAVGPVGRLHPVLLSAIGVVLLALVAGPLALILLPLLAVALRWGPHVTSWIAGGAFLAAGVAVACSPGAEPATHLGAFGVPAQLGTAIALAALMASVVAIERARGLGRRQETPDDAARPSGDRESYSGVPAEDMRERT